MQTAQIRRRPPNWDGDPTIADLDVERLDDPAAGAPDAAATASIVHLAQGLYALDIAEIPGLAGKISGIALPALQIAPAPFDRGAGIEIMGVSGNAASWLGRDGGVVVVSSPPGGGQLLVTSYGMPDHPMIAAKIGIRRLDRSASNAAPAEPVMVAPVIAAREIRTEIVLHMERLGDRRFPGEGWLGNRGQKLRIEAFSIRPLETLPARDIEFRAFGPKGRETPWVNDAKLCGTRGRGLALTGFAVRLAPHLRDRFDVVYEGAFFESGVAGPSRNGEPCMPRIVDDPLEAINVRLVERIDL